MAVGTQNRSNTGLGRLGLAVAPASWHGMAGHEHAAFAHINLAWRRAADHFPSPWCRAQGKFEKHAHVGPDKKPMDVLFEKHSHVEPDKKPFNA